MEGGSRKRDMSGSAEPGSQDGSKRMRAEGKSVDAVLYESLALTWMELKKLTAEEIKRVEIEIRIGMLGFDGARINAGKGAVAYPDHLPSKPAFTSGMDEALVQRVQRVLEAQKYIASAQPLQRLRFSADGRVRVDMASPGSAPAEKKRRVFRSDVGCPSLFYDIRVDVAVEEEVQAPCSSEFAWSTERHKRRTSYASRQRGSFWRVDLTEVQTFINGKNGSTSDIELEFEMLSEMLVAWCSCPDEQVVAETSKIVLELSNLIRSLIPGHRDDSTAHVLHRRPDVRTKENIKQRVAELRRDGRLDYIGAMPINLTRRNFASVRKNNYFLTEKSDGLRYLLFVVNGAEEKSRDPPHPIAVLMDRSGELILMQGAGVIGRALGVGTVLDGEMVFNLSWQLNVFLVFDVLALDVDSKVSLPFRHRIDLVKTDVMPRCKDYINQHWNTRNNAGSPTILVRKDFLPKQDMQLLLAKVVEEDGCRVFHDVESGGRRHHRSDGIILQPADLPYTFGTDTNLLKWKWPELISVDLAVNGDGEHPRLLTTGPDNTYIDCAKYTEGALTIGKFDSMRLRGDLAALSKVKRGLCIAEFVYDTAVGLWTYFHIREDKDKPNHISTVLSVLMEQAEAVSVEELHYRLLARTDAEND